MEMGVYNVSRTSQAGMTLLCNITLHIQLKYFELILNKGLVFLVLWVRTSHSQTMNSQTCYF